MVDIKPAYEVHEVPCEGLTRRLCERKKEGGFEYKEVPETRRCFEVYFPAGHSIRVRGEDALERLGLSKNPALVDMESGDVVPQAAPVSLKEHVQRVTKPTKPKGN